MARFNRRGVIGVAACACVLLFAATIIALYPPSLRSGASGAELLNTDRKQVADGLAALPHGYGDLAPKPAPPKLGPPLPGDLGLAVTHVEHNLGVPPALPASLRPNPEDDAARAERMRLAREAREARTLSF